MYDEYYLRPNGVSAAAGFYFVLGALSILGGLLALTDSGFLVPLGLGGYGATTAMTLLATGAVYLAVGWGLWELRDWGRIGAIVVSVLSLISLLGSIYYLVRLGVTSWAILSAFFAGVHGWIIYFLNLPDIRDLFQTSGFEPGRVGQGRTPLEPTQRATPPPPLEPQRVPEPQRVGKIDPTSIMGAPPPVTAWLVQKSSGRAGKQYSLAQARNTIGRDATRCDVVLDNDTVSAEHAAVLYENGQFVLCDLASTNGTFLNQRRIQRQSLWDGDVVRLGEVTLVFKTA